MRRLNCDNCYNYIVTLQRGVGQLSHSSFNWLSRAGLNGSRSQSLPAPRLQHIGAAWRVSEKAGSAAGASGRTGAEGFLPEFYEQHVVQ